MKIKILVVLIIFTIILVFSYAKTNKEEINYTILGDKNIYKNNLISKNFSDLIYDELKKQDNFGVFNKNFIKEDIRIIDVINQIKNNEIIEDKSIQNILKKTNILILHIGNNEINYKLSKVDINFNDDKVIYKYLNEVLKDYINLIDDLKKYNIENIIILGNYNDTNNLNNNKYYSYINKQIEEYSKNNNIHYIDLQDLLANNKYLTNTSSVYITSNGNLAIFDKIYTKIDNLYLHKTI